MNPFRYRSYVYDDETGLYYLKSRYFDPITGRFLNAADMTIDEYYRYQKELFRKELTISNYLNSEKKELAKKTIFLFMITRKFFQLRTKLPRKIKNIINLRSYGKSTIRL